MTNLLHRARDVHQQQTGSPILLGQRWIDGMPGEWAELLMWVGGRAATPTPQDVMERISLPDLPPLVLPEMAKALFVLVFACAVKRWEEMTGGDANGYTDEELGDLMNDFQKGDRVVHCWAQRAGLMMAYADALQKGVRRVEFDGKTGTIENLMRTLPRLPHL
jgi:hypothetical protein